MDIDIYEIIKNSLFPTVNGLVELPEIDGINPTSWIVPLGQSTG